MKKLIVIAAVGKNNELGKNNDLIWHLKGDMKFFKKATTNHHVLMGKNTYFSLPKMLPNRVHLVLDDTNSKFPSDVIVLKSIDEFLKKANDIDDDIYVIGGAYVYKEFVKLADKIILTHIDDEDLDADVYFPKIDYNLYTKKVLEENISEVPNYKIISYDKK